MAARRGRAAWTGGLEEAEAEEDEEDSEEEKSCEKASLRVRLLMNCLGCCGICTVWSTAPCLDCSAESEGNGGRERTDGSDKLSLSYTSPSSSLSCSGDCCCVLSLLAVADDLRCWPHRTLNLSLEARPRPSTVGMSCSDWMATRRTEAEAVVVGRSDRWGSGAMAGPVWLLGCGCECCRRRRRCWRREVTGRGLSCSAESRRFSRLRSHRSRIATGCAVVDIVKFSVPENSRGSRTLLLH